MTLWRVTSFIYLCALTISPIVCEAAVATPSPVPTPQGIPTRAPSPAIYATPSMPPPIVTTGLGGVVTAVKGTPATCGDNYTCGNNGSGRPSCSTDLDCKVTRCSNGKCQPGGTGLPCNIGDDAPCSQLRCSFGKCVPGGTGITCTGTPDSNECSSKSCVLDGPGENGSWRQACTYDVSDVTCKKQEDCPEAKPNRCTSSGQCSSQGDGAYCTSAEHCKVYRCQDGQCRRGGIFSGYSCTPGADPNICKMKRCTVDVVEPALPGQVQPGSSCSVSGTGVPCIFDSQCIGHKACKRARQGISATSVYVCMQFRGISGDDTCSGRGRIGNSEDSCDREQVAVTPSPGYPASYSENEDNTSRARLGEIPPGTDEIQMRHETQGLLAQGQFYSIGQASAPVKIVMFQDFDCGMCAYAMKNIIPNLKRDYIDTGKVHFSFAEFPLGMAAKDVALSHAALCAGEQGRYFDFARSVYLGHPVKMQQLSVLAYDLGLNETRFDSCMRARHYDLTIADHVKLGEALGVTGTPHFWINGTSAPGSRPYEDFKAVVDVALHEQASRTNP